LGSSKDEELLNLPAWNPKPSREPCRESAPRRIRRSEIAFDWAEAFRIAALPAYGVTAELETLIDEQAKALNVRNPRDSHG